MGIRPLKLVISDMPVNQSLVVVVVPKFGLRKLLLDCFFDQIKLFLVLGSNVRVVVQRRHENDSRVVTIPVEQFPVDCRTDGLLVFGAFAGDDIEDSLLEVFHPIWVFLLISDIIDIEGIALPEMSLFRCQNQNKIENRVYTILTIQTPRLLIIAIIVQPCRPPVPI